MKFFSEIFLKMPKGFWMSTVLAVVISGAAFWNLSLYHVQKKKTVEHLVKEAKLVCLTPSVTIKAPANGTISELFFKSGQPVKAGQVLFIVSNRTRVRQTPLANYSLPSGAALTMLPALPNVPNVPDLSPMPESNTGNIKTEYNEAVSSLKQKETLLATKEQMMESYKSLYSDGGLSKKEMSTIESDYIKVKDEVVAARQNVAMLKSNLLESKKAKSVPSPHYTRAYIPRAVSTYKTEKTQAKATMTGIVRLKLKKSDSVKKGADVLALDPANPAFAVQTSVTVLELPKIHLKQIVRMKNNSNFSELKGIVSAISPSSYNPKTEVQSYLVNIKPVQENPKTTLLNIFNASKNNTFLVDFGF